MPAVTQADLVGKIMDYEAGDMDTRGVLELFAELVKTGSAWSLQGHYGRMAAGLIDAGWITPTGELTDQAHGHLAELGV